jgi:shikimate kinase
VNGPVSALDGGAPLWLVGFMASGKTVVGRELAARLGWGFVDTDERVVETSGRTIEAIFRECGEGRFRELEWDVLLSLAAIRRTVVAAGGGLFLGVPQRRLMKRTGVVAWLDVPLSIAAARIGAGPERPLWPASDAALRRVLFERRRAVYALADVRVDGASGGPRDVAQSVLDAFSR